MVCNCGNTHDALVASQFRILPGGKGQQQRKGQACSPVVGGWQQSIYRGKGGGQVSPGNPNAPAWGKGAGKQQVPSPKQQQHRGGPNGNRWGKQQPSQPPSQAASEAGAGSDPQDIPTRLTTLQAVMSSIKGRSDIEATELRTLTENQIARLRVQADSAKSVPQQISKLQQAISKKTKTLDEANTEVASLTAKLEEASAKASAANAALSEMQIKLKGLLSQCSVDSSATAVDQTDQQQAQLQNMAQFGSLLPPELAMGFNEAMRHLLQLMNMNIKADPIVIEVAMAPSTPVNSAPDAAVMSPSSTMASGAAPTTPATMSSGAAASSSPVTASSGLGGTPISPAASAWVNARRGRSSVGTSLFGGADAESERSRSQHGGAGSQASSRISSTSLRRRLRGKQDGGDAYRARSLDRGGELPSGPRYFSSDALISPSEVEA